MHHQAGTLWRHGRCFTRRRRWFARPSLAECARLGAHLGLGNKALLLLLLLLLLRLHF
jgi:hypothetical protein